MFLHHTQRRTTVGRTPLDERLIETIIARTVYLYKQLHLWQSRHYLMVSPWHQSSFDFQLSIRMSDQILSKFTDNQAINV
jgi:hypothetical protein